MSFITYDENFASSVRCVVRNWNRNNIEGPQGPTGLGYTGSIGPTGPQGLPGTTTGTGATGPNGFQGAQGPTGSQGLPGTTTGTGATGYTGSTGPQGQTGSQGDQGIPGRPGTEGPTGPVITSFYGSFISNQSQLLNNSNPLTNPTAITYTSITVGNIGVTGSFPTSSIVIPSSGVYKVLFSAQCISSGQHFIQIWPVINGLSVPDSNTKIGMTSSNESCLTVEYLLSFSENDILQFYMAGDSTNVQIIYINGNNTTTPTTPGSPSIIVDIYKIA